MLNRDFVIEVVREKRKVIAFTYSYWILSWCTPKRKYFLYERFLKEEKKKEIFLKST